MWCFQNDTNEKIRLANMKKKKKKKKKTKKTNKTITEFAHTRVRSWNFSHTNPQLHSLGNGVVI